MCSTVFGYSADVVTAIATVITGIFAIIIACKQLEINKKTIKIELAIRYKEHYCKLNEALNNLMSSNVHNMQFSSSAEVYSGLNEVRKACTEIYYLKCQAELLFDKDIVDANIEINELSSKMILTLTVLKDAEIIENQKAVDVLRSEFIEIRDKISSYRSSQNLDSSKPTKLLSLYLTHTKVLRATREHCLANW